MADLRASRPAWPVACAAGLLLLAARSTPAAALSVKVVDTQGKPLPDAAVSVLVKGVPARAADARAEMSQKDRSFQPGMLVVQTGTSVSFPNYDTVRHHIYSFSAIKPFEIKLYAGTPAAPVVFDKPGTAVLGCNIHDQMSAFIVVVDTPHFAKTDAQGHATLELPAGEHRLQVWQAVMGAEQAPRVQPLKIGTGAAAVTVTLGAGKGGS